MGLLAFVTSSLQLLPSCNFTCILDSKIIIIKDDGEAICVDNPARCTTYKFKNKRNGYPLQLMYFDEFLEEKVLACLLLSWIVSIVGVYLNAL
jgi:hypothetical protein